MILKYYELKNKRLSNNIVLLYGTNDGLKDEIVNDIIKIFNCEISRYDEVDLLSKKEIFLSEIKNESLFSNERIVIISRVTYKITDFFKSLCECGH